MTKLEIIKSLESFSDNEQIVFADGLSHVYQLEPRSVCGGRQAYMPYYCVLKLGHSGECYCANKDVSFIKESDEEIEKFYQEMLIRPVKKT